MMHLAMAVRGAVPPWHLAVACSATACAVGSTPCRRCMCDIAGSSATSVSRTRGDELERRLPIRRDTLRADAVAGLVLGVQSVPDGLATGLLAGVNPLAGLYAYIVGTFTGALITSSAFMAIQGTGAMAMIVADVPGLHQSADAERALVTLSILTGVIMLAAGLLKLGGLLRFVSNAVMVGFINAVGVNIVLGQLADGRIVPRVNADGLGKVLGGIPGRLSHRQRQHGRGLRDVLAAYRGQYIRAYVFNR